jgi:opacity protein-like surface antigen
MFFIWRIGFISLAASAVILLSTSPALAQSLSGTHVGAMAGPLFPTGDATDTYGRGYQVSVFIDHQAVKVPLGVRLELGYSRQPFRGARGVGSATEDVVFGSGSVIVADRSGKLRPFALAGLGLYRVSVSGEGNDPYNYSHIYPVSAIQTKPGWQAGAGISFPVGARSRVFLEVRYTQIWTTESSPLIPSQFVQVPLLLGVSF